jgi:glycolate oxidase
MFMVGFDNAVEALERLGLKLLAGPQALRDYGYDGLRGFRASARSSRAERIVVVYPRSTEDVVEAVNVANNFLIPIIPAGGMTGLMGGAIPVRDSIILDMREMNRVIEVSVDDRRVLCEAGVTLEDLDRRLRMDGLMLGHDPWTKPYATVGGSISTNGMGYTAAAYGSIRQQVLGLEVVLPDSTIITTRAVEDTSTGPSLTHLLIGSEGVLGIITKAMLRVYPIPEAMALKVFRFDSFEKGFKAIIHLLRNRVTPTALEYGEVFDGPADPMGDYISELFIMFEGFGEEVEAKTRRLEKIMRDFDAVEMEDRRAEEFWEHRHDTAYRYMEHVKKDDVDRWMAGRVFDFMHVSLPSSKVLDYRRRSGEILARHGFNVVDRGIWKSPENFSIAFTGGSRGFAGDSGVMAMDELVALAHGLGGSMEYCHGVGIKLSSYMVDEHGVAGLELLRRIKKAVDPNNIMNPGKLGL